MNASEPTGETLRAALLAMAERRRPEATFCPSEVARALAEDWRPLMPPLREAARQLARQGRLEVSQGGTALDPEAVWKGPIRLRLA